MESGETAENMSRDRGGGKVRLHERSVTHEGLWFHGPPHLPSVLSSLQQPFFFFPSSLFSHSVNRRVFFFSLVS